MPLAVCNDLLRGLYPLPGLLQSEEPESPTMNLVLTSALKASELGRRLTRGSVGVWESGSFCVCIGKKPENPSLTSPCQNVVRRENRWGRL